MNAEDIEREVRMLARQQGYQLRRGSWPNGAQFQLSDSQGRVVLGSRYDSSLSAVVTFLRQDPADRARPVF